MFVYILTIRQTDFLRIKSVSLHTRATLDEIPCFVQNSDPAQEVGEEILSGEKVHGKENGLLFTNLVETLCFSIRWFLIK